MSNSTDASGWRLNRPNSEWRAKEWFVVVTASVAAALILVTWWQGRTTDEDGEAPRASQISTSQREANFLAMLHKPPPEVAIDPRIPDHEWLTYGWEFACPALEDGRKN